MIRRFYRRHREGIALTAFILAGTLAALLTAGYAVAIGVTPWTS